MFGKKRGTADSGRDETRERFAEMLVAGVATEGLVLDYSTASARLLDDYVQVVREPLTASGSRDAFLGLAGSYLGEVLRRNALGAGWIAHDLGPAIRLPNGQLAFPFTKIAKRFDLGPEHDLEQFVRAAVDPAYAAEQRSTGAMTEREPGSSL